MSKYLHLTMRDILVLTKLKMQCTLKLQVAHISLDMLSTVINQLLDVSL